MAVAANEQLVARVRRVLSARKGVTEKRMFGGVAFLLNGHMVCGPVGDKLMVRLGDEGAAAALAEPFVKPMDFTGKVMKSMVFVEADGIAEDQQLRGWVRRAIAFVQTLQPKR